MHIRRTRGRTVTSRVTMAIGFAAGAVALTGTGVAAANSHSKIPPPRGDAAYLGRHPAADYTQNVWASFSNEKKLLPAVQDKPETLLSSTVYNSAPHKAGVLDFEEAEFTNNNQGPVTVTLGLEVNGKVMTQRWGQTIAPGATQSIFGVLKCNGMPVGRNTLNMVVLSSTGELTVGSLANDGMRPITVPSGHSSFGSSW